MTIYDEDDNGYITKEELLQFAMNKARAEGRLINDKNEEGIRNAVDRLISLIDENSDGQISKEELITAIDRDPGLKKVL